MRSSKYLGLLLVCGSALPVAAQQPEVQALLDNAGKQASDQATSLPSFACERSGTSELVKASDGSVKKHAVFTGEVRAVRGNGHGLHEQLTYTSVNGKPQRTRDGVPYDVHESFTGALHYVALPEQHCYRYTAHPSEDGGTRLDFTAAEPFERECENLPGTEGYALFDGAGNITHIERTIPERLANEADLVPFGAVDLAPVMLNGTTYRLVSRLRSERQDGNEIRRVDVAYTNCRLFHADVKLLPDSTESAP